MSQRWYQRLMEYCFDVVAGPPVLHGRAFIDNLELRVAERMGSTHRIFKKIGSSYFAEFSDDPWGDAVESLNSVWDEVVTQWAEKNNINLHDIGRS